MRGALAAIIIIACGHPVHRPSKDAVRPRVTSEVSPARFGSYRLSMR